MSSRRCSHFANDSYFFVIYIDSQVMYLFIHLFIFSISYLNLNSDQFVEKWTHEKQKKGIEKEKKKNVYKNIELIWAE